jgi:anti-sigma factor RsiW
MPEFWNRIFGRRGRDGDAAGLACQELVELVTDYFEDALSEADRARFEAHIAGCVNCTAYVQQMREMLAVLGELTTESLSAEAEAELLVVFRDWKAS